MGMHALGDAYTCLLCCVFQLFMQVVISFDIGFTQVTYFLTLGGRDQYAYFYS